MVPAMIAEVAVPLQTVGSILCVVIGAGKENTIGIKRKTP
jgi:hypothetical protein